MSEKKEHLVYIWVMVCSLLCVRSVLFLIWFRFWCWLDLVCFLFWFVFGFGFHIVFGLILVLCWVLFFILVLVYFCFLILFRFFYMFYFQLFKLFLVLVCSRIWNNQEKLLKEFRQVLSKTELTIRRILTNESESGGFRVK